MSFIYTRAQFKSRINAGIQGRIGILISPEDTMNEAVREVNARLDLITVRRRVAMTPGLFGNNYDYACPADMNTYAIIDIPQQARRADGEFFLIPSSQFEVYKPKGAIAVDDFNGARILKVATRENAKVIVLSDLSSALASATWLAFGDGTGLDSDPDDFILGNGSLTFDISAAGGLTAGIYTNTLNSVDISTYLRGASAVFVNAKIISLTGLTNFILRLGSSSSNYYQITVTARNDGTAFQTGWNMLRFDMVNMTQVGTPDPTKITYAALYMTKTAGKVSETDYKFNYLQLATGAPAEIEYYSKFGWQDSTGAYKENSTDDSDVLVADVQEFNLLVKMGRYMAANEVDISAPGRNPMLKLQQLMKDYTDAEAQYKLDYPSESKIMTSEYYSYNGFRGGNGMPIQDTGVNGNNASGNETWLE